MMRFFCSTFLVKIILGASHSAASIDNQPVDVWARQGILDNIPLNLTEGYSPLLSNEYSFTKFHLDKSKSNKNQHYFYVLQGPKIQTPALQCNELSLCLFKIKWDKKILEWNVEPHEYPGYFQKTPTKLPNGLTEWEFQVQNHQPIITHIFYGAKMVRSIVSNNIGWCEAEPRKVHDERSCLDEWQPTYLSLVHDKVRFFNTIFSHADAHLD